MPYKITLLSLIILFFSCTSTETESFDLLITNASILDISEGSISKHKVIGISNDTIRLVASVESVNRYTADQIIDAKNNFVMPGLWDMHVHFRGGDSLIAENKDLLPLYIAHGVTTVRDAGGDITPSVLEWRSEIRDGKLLGPDIFTSGPKFDGVNPAWDGSIRIENTNDIDPAMDSLMQLEVDYFKTYDGSLSNEMYYALIKEAESRNVNITGHMPMNASLMKAVNLGLDGIEHLYYALNATSPMGDSLTQLNRGYGILPELLESYDYTLANEVFIKLASKNFYATPTLYIGKILNQLPFDDHSEDSLLTSMGKGIQETYSRRIKSAMSRSASAQEFNTSMREKFVEMVKPMHEAGINLLAGSDCGAYNSYVYPGASLHGELFMLVEAGLTPLQALQTSIINGPQFFELDNYFGSLDVGKVANLIILSENPTQNIQSIKKIEWVVKNQNTFNADQLKLMITLKK
ncbi:amidohydrolase family protein [Ekhidna sp.]